MPGQNLKAKDKNRFTEYEREEVSEGRMSPSSDQVRPPPLISGHPHHPETFVWKDYSTLFNYHGATLSLSCDLSPESSLLSKQMLPGSLEKQTNT